MIYSGYTEVKGYIKMQILIENKKIILEAIKKSREQYNINDLVKQLPSNYKAYEELDNKTGLEEW